MPRDQISLALDRQDKPIRFTQRVWTSEDSPWGGLELERHVVGPVGSLQDFAVPEALLGLCLRGAANLRFGSDLHGKQAVVRPGRFTLLAAGGEQPPIHWTGTRETLYVAIRAADVDRLMGADRPPPGSPAATRLAPQYAATDAQVSRLVLNMLDEAAAGSPAGKLYAEALSIALVAYLARTYGRSARPAARLGGRLSRTIAARVVDYMQAHLDRNVSLLELAQLVGLSPHHFSLVFKNTFDTTPHHYLLMQRVEKAKALLAAGEQSIGEAALEVGFASQSHFTRIFRRLCGQTPRAWQQTH